MLRHGARCRIVALALCFTIFTALKIATALRSILPIKSKLFSSIKSQQYPRIGRQHYCRFNAGSTTELFAKDDETESKDTESKVKKSRILLDDFNQILEAITIYKGIFGDTKIYDRYEVPAEAPWPPSLHGLRLGKRLKRIVSSRGFKSNYPDKAVELRKVGFEPELSSFSDEWSMLMEALETYKKVYGDLRVKARFVVPDEAPWSKRIHGMRLGVRVAAIRSTGRFVKDSPERKQELEDLGFEWNMKKFRLVPNDEDREFANIVEALKIYKKRESKNFVITNGYVIPSEDPWPEHLHEMKLGMIVKRIRQKERYIANRGDRRKILEKIGFDFNDVTSRESLADARFQLIFKALLKYKELHGTANVPPTFVVPEDDVWPEETWGIKLGIRSNAIRSQGTFVSNSPERRQLLDSIGFSWDISSRKKRSEEEDEEQISDSQEEAAPRRHDFLSSLDQSIRDAQFRAEGQDTGEDAFTRAARAAAAAGLVEMSDDIDSPLAIAAGGVRNIDMPDSILQELLVRGPFTSYPWFFGDTYREIASEARRDYLRYRDYHPDPAIRQFGHFEGWMQVADLNEIMNRRVTAEARKKMMKLGYRMMDFNEFYWEDVLDALTIYKSAFDNVDVPVSFSISDDILERNIGFPQEYRGMRLGHFVKGLRIGDYDGLEDSSRRKQLDELGFDWGDTKNYLRFRFFPMYYGLRVFTHLYQIPIPSTSFVVPDEEQWPVWMYNMPLGEWTAAARIQQQLLRERYPDRVDLLDTLEFDWFIPPGPSMPSKYYRLAK